MAAQAIECDLLVIGSGIAGLWAAISARQAGVERVAIVDKGAIAMSSQSRMAAGATIYCLPGDDADLWIRDLVEAQSFLSRQEAISDLVTTSHSRLAHLESWGVRYAPGMGGEKYFRLPSRGLPHVKMLVRPEYRRRVGGVAVVQALRTQAARLGIARYPRILTTALVRSNAANERVAGAVGVHRTKGEPQRFLAGGVVLAAGDCSFRGNYAGTDAATGDAFCLAYDAGARLSNMEFLCVNTGPPTFGFEGTGLVLRFGGKLVDASGRAFMADHHPEGDRAEVSHLVQAMAREARRGNGPPFYLDLTAASRDFLEPALATMGGFMALNLDRLQREGVDVFGDRQEWVPCVQSLRGGVRTDATCHSDVGGLFVAGLSQALDQGLFNGWSTARAMWSGEKAGRAAAAFLADAGPVGTGGSRDSPMAAADELAAAEAAAVAPLRRAAGPQPDDVLAKLHALLFPYDVCILKEAGRLTTALAALEETRDADLPRMQATSSHELAKAHETENMVRVAEMFLRASLAREESRGDHCREDYPDTDNRNWLAWTNIRKDAEGKMALEFEPVPLQAYPFRPEESAAT